MTTEPSTETQTVSNRVLIGRWSYPFAAGELTALTNFATGWCKRNGYEEPYIATDGPHYADGFMTIVAEPKAAEERR